MVRPSSNSLLAGGGIGLTLLGLALPYIWKDIPTYLSYPIFFIGIVLVCWSLFHGILWHTRLGNAFTPREYGHLSFQEMADRLYPPKPWWKKFKKEKLKISLREAAQKIYLKAKELDHIWYHIIEDYRNNAMHGEGGDERRINACAGLISDQIAIYGFPPLSGKPERIRLKGSKLEDWFGNYAAKFQSDGVLWTDLYVFYEDMESVFKHLEYTQHESL